MKGNLLYRIYVPLLICFILCTVKTLALEEERDVMESETVIWTETEGVWQGDGWYPDEAWEEEAFTEPLTEMYDETEKMEEVTERFPESETEEMTERMIWVRDVTLANDEAYKIYDGTNLVEVTGTAFGLEEGEILYLQGETPQADVGVYPVAVTARIVNKDGEDLEELPIINIEEAALEYEIRPRPLFIEISDARLPSDMEAQLWNLTFLSEDAISVYGFITDENGMEIVPKEFELPLLFIDPEGFGKEIWFEGDDSEVICQDAITLAYKEDGTLTGNATANYCFWPEEEAYCKKGSIIIERNPETETESETELSTEENVYEPDREETEAVTEEEKDIQRETQMETEPVEMDETLPYGEIWIDGVLDDHITQYIHREVRIRISVQDDESGLKTAETFLGKDIQEGMTAKEIYQSRKEEFGGELAFTCSFDGCYQVFVRMEDQAGNVSYMQSKRIIVDQKAPEITIANVREGSANRGTVMPVLTCTDKYLRPETVTFELTGSANGSLIPDFQINGRDQEVEIQIFDLPHKKEWDDVYELRVSAVDLAGNQADRKIRFSVNRFGSTYYIEENCAETLAPFYLNEAPDIMIEEINVDELQSLNIMVGFEDEIYFLEQGKDYTVTRSGQRWGWNKYTYFIPGKVFVREGYYYLVCSSTDRAENTGDNRMQKKYLEFALDTTPPEIILTGIENGGKYEGKRRIHAECIDNFPQMTTQVIMNEETVMSQEGGSCSFWTQPGDQWQTLKVTATDMAGNTSESGEIRFLCTDMEKEKIQTDEEEKEDITDQGLDEKKTEKQNSEDRNRRETGETKSEKETEKTEKSMPQRAEYGLIVFGILALISGIFCKCRILNE